MFKSEGRVSRTERTDSGKPPGLVQDWCFQVNRRPVWQSAINQEENGTKRAKGREVMLTILFAISEPVKFKRLNKQLVVGYLSLGFEVRVQNWRYKFANHQLRCMLCCSTLSSAWDRSSVYKF